jgi:hypothetical protein
MTRLRLCWLDEIETSVPATFRSFALGNVEYNSAKAFIRVLSTGQRANIARESGQIVINELIWPYSGSETAISEGETMGERVGVAKAEILHYGHINLRSHFSLHFPYLTQL